MIRDDRRDVGMLWVIHSTGNDRPELETLQVRHARRVTTVAQPELVMV